MAAKTQTDSCRPIAIVVAAVITTLCMGLGLAPRTYAGAMPLSSVAAVSCRPATAANNVKPPPLPWESYEVPPPTAEETSYVNHLGPACPSGEVPTPSLAGNVLKAAHATYVATEQRQQVQAERSTESNAAGSLRSSQLPDLSSPPEFTGQNCREVNREQICYWYVSDEVKESTIGFEYGTSIAQPVLSKAVGGHSLSQLNAGGGTGNNQYTMEAGFTVDPSLAPSDPTQPHFFIFVNSAKYLGTGSEDCYDCDWTPLAGENNIYPGEAFAPSSAKIRVGVKFYNNSWWIFAGTKWVAYVPESYWGGHFTHATRESVYGEVADRESGPTSQMGNGQPGTSAGAATMTAPILFLNENTDETTGLNSKKASEFVSDPNLYSLGHLNKEQTEWHYGGSGHSDPPPTTETEPATSVTATTATLSGLINPNYGETYGYFEMGPTAEYLWALPAAPGYYIGSGGVNVRLSSEITGLQPATTYHYRVRATNDEGTSFGQDQTLTTLPVPPRVKTLGGESFQFKPGQALLWGEVDPEGTDTHFQCEYGTTPSLGQIVPAQAVDVGSGRSWTKNRCEPEHLTPNVTYYYRLTASNSAGAAYGATESFKTEYRAYLATEPATGVTSTEATLHGVVNPEGHDTKYRFNLTSIDSVAFPQPETDLGSGTENLPVTDHLTGLEEGWTYKWSLFAENNLGGQSSTSQTPMYFVTPPQLGSQTTPNESGASRDSIAGISCVKGTKGTKLCVAVADDSTPLVPHGAYVARLTGTQWSGQAVPSPEGTNPFWLNGVSCASTTECVAAGSYETPAGQMNPLIERWNGTAWVVERPPTPTGTASAFKSVSCASSEVCVAVGSSVNTEGSKALVEMWNGSAWSIQSVANPREATKTLLNGVSCSSTKNCIVVGQTNEWPAGEKGESYGFIERWHGTEWEAQKFTPLGGTTENFTGISCGTAALCEIVATNIHAGETSPAQLTWAKGKFAYGAEVYTEQWTTKNALTSVACWTKLHCLATGEDLSPQQSKAIYTLRKQNEETEVFGGSYLPLPHEGASATLSASACLASNECWVGGQYETGSGETAAFIDGY